MDNTNPVSTIKPLLVRRPAETSCPDTRHSEKNICKGFKSTRLSCRLSKVDDLTCNKVTKQEIRRYSLYSSKCLTQSAQILWTIRSSVCPLLCLLIVLYFISKIIGYIQISQPKQPIPNQQALLCLSTFHSWYSDTGLSAICTIFLELYGKNI